MTLSEVGEFGLIQDFSRRFTERLPPDVVGIGDDCSVVPLGSGVSSLVTTDLLVENVHFLRRAISAQDLGHKSLAVSLSDIAAMGGRPISCYLSLALPTDLSVEWVGDFFRGFGDLAARHQVHLLGGDTTRSSHAIVINVTVTGEVQAERVKLRSSAQPGDIICVTGWLGDSAAGLHALLNAIAGAPFLDVLVSRHHSPVPHLSEGEWLSARPEVGAMMDVSDGIDSDLRRIMERSKCGARVDIERVPVSREMSRYATSQGVDGLEWALAGGEDYCLLLSVRPEAFPAFSREFSAQFARPIFPIGEITGDVGILEYRDRGRPYSLRSRGFDHFSGGKNGQ